MPGKGVTVGAYKEAQSFEYVSLVVCTIGKGNRLYFDYIEELICEEGSDFEQLFVGLEFEEGFFTKRSHQVVIVYNYVLKRGWKNEMDLPWKSYHD